MAQQFRLLPSIRALVAFESAARNLSFTKAGAELLVTRVAVSRQVKLLEEQLGLQLIFRERRLRLSPAGEQLYRVVNAAFYQILEVIEHLCLRSNPNIIRLSTTPGMSIYWLMPRIGKFRQQHPEIDFSIDNDVKLCDLTRDGFDIAIRYGSGDWVGTESRLLCYQYIAPTCSPGYLAGRERLTEPAQLLNEHLLHFDLPYRHGSSWPKWFADHGVDYVDNHRQSRFSSYVNTVQAVLDGQGVALVGPPTLQQFYDNAQMVYPLETEPVQLKGYYLVWQTRTPISPVTSKFMDWVIAELSQPDRLAGPLRQET